MNGAYQVLRGAILNRQQVTLTHHGHVRQVCPHVIGHTDGHPQVLVFQFAGGSNTGLPPGGQWRCMDVREISNASANDGQWHTGYGHTRPQTCVKQIDVEVAH